MATKKIKLPYEETRTSDFEDREGNRFSGRAVSDKPYEGEYEYVGNPDAPDAGGGRGFINPPMAKQDYSGKMNVRGETPKGYRHRKEPDEGPIKKMASGGYTKAADGCAQRGKTRGKFV